MIEIRPETQPNQGEFELLDDPSEILAPWTSEIDQAGPGEKVWLRTMLCREGTVMGTLEPSLVRASQRGAVVRIILDPISYYLSNDGMPSFLRYAPFPGRSQAASDYDNNRQMLERLGRDISVEFSRPESIARQVFPYKGADHIKGTRIRDKFYFGNKNLEDGSFIDMRGFVVRITNPEIVEQLTNIIGSTQSPAKDKTTEIQSDPDTKIFWDAGIPNTSVIFDEALEMIISEQDFIGTSVQFLPDGKFLEELEMALERDVRVETITSRERVFSASIPYYVVNRINAKRMLMAGSPLRVAFAPPDGVHAKYVVTPDKVEFGTNNHSEWGLRAGTAELALVSTNPALVAQVRAFHDRLFQASIAVRNS